MNKINKVDKRPLGSQGLIVSAQGLGCMGMTAFYTANTKEEDKLHTIGTALELGINFFDTAWVYQDFKTGETNEELLGKAIKKYGREQFIIATKFGLGIKDGKSFTSGKPDFVRQQCNESLTRLGIQTIDLYYMHRMDPTTPIETTMEELKMLKDEGKIKYIGLSECTVDELQRAHKISPITAIQMEWSLQTRNIEDDLVPCARKLGIGIVAYSPLGRGLLTAGFSNECLDKDDWRNSAPRFDKENLDKNKEASIRLEQWGNSKGLTSSQVALAWVHSRGKDVFPIPGTKNSNRLRENAYAASIELSEKECKEIEDIVPKPYGSRFNKTLMEMAFESRK